MKPNIPKLKFDNVFEIRDDFSLNIQFPRFFNTTIVGKIFDNSLKCFYWSLFFKIMIGGCL